jgi:hypothetical protein
MIESELKKLTPSARKAVLALEKQHEDDDQELRVIHARNSARRDMELCGKLLRATSTAFEQAKTMLRGYIERTQVVGTLALLTIDKRALNPDGADNIVMIHKHLAEVAANYRDRSKQLLGAIEDTRKALTNVAQVAFDEYALIQFLEAHCDDWRKYIGEWPPAPGAPRAFEKALS